MIEFNLSETVNGVRYSVYIWSVDSITFRVIENGKYEKFYDSKEDFLLDFPELEDWFWKED